MLIYLDIFHFRDSSFNSNIAIFFLNIHSTVPTQNLHRSRTSCSTTTSQNTVSLEWIFSVGEKVQSYFASIQTKRRLRRAVVLLEAPEGSFWKLL